MNLASSKAHQSVLCRAGHTFKFFNTEIFHMIHLFQKLQASYVSAEC